MRDVSAREAREQMITEGYCIVPNVLTDGFVAELTEETARINATEEHHPDTKYQGTHVGVKFEENAAMKRLSEWQPSRDALTQIGFGDFAPGQGLLVLTKPAPDPPSIGIRIGDGGTIH